MNCFANHSAGFPNLGRLQIGEIAGIQPQILAVKIDIEELPGSEKNEKQQRFHT